MNCGKRIRIILVCGLLWCRTSLLSLVNNNLFVIGLMLQLAVVTIIRRLVPNLPGLLNRLLGNVVGMDACVIRSVLLVSTLSEVLRLKFNIWVRYVAIVGQVLISGVAIGAVPRNYSERVRVKLVTDGLLNRQLFRLCRSRRLNCDTTAGYRRSVRLVDRCAVSLLSNSLVWLVTKVPTVLGGKPLKCIVTDLGRNIRSIVRRNIIELV